MTKKIALLMMCLFALSLGFQLAAVVYTEGVAQTLGFMFSVACLISLAVWTRMFRNA